MSPADCTVSVRVPPDLATELSAAAASALSNPSDLVRRAIHSYLQRLGRDVPILESVRRAKECEERNRVLESRNVDLERQLAAALKALAKAESRVQEQDLFARVKVKVGRENITYQDSLALVARAGNRATLEDLAAREEQDLFARLGQDPLLAAPPIFRPLFMAHGSWMKALAAVVA